MLDELRRLRRIQVAQRAALSQGDVDALEALSAERDQLQTTVRPLGSAGLSPADLAEARALADLLMAEQAALVAAATEVRDRLGGEIAGLKRGRTAVAGYRPHADSNALYLDSAR